MELSQQESLKRKLCFTPCKTKHDLWLWIKIFLDLDMPTSIVDENSNSCPMDLIWELYEAALTNNENLSRLLGYASRGSFKTIAAAIFEVLCLSHLKRDVVHMAAILQHSEKAQSYVRKLIDQSVLREFVIGDNKRTIEILYYFNKDTQTFLTFKEWKNLPRQEATAFEPIKNYIKVIVCTMGSANGEHAPVFICDEIEVVQNPAAYEEAKLVPTQMGEMPPITFLTSTRKFSFGLVQKEIDEASQTGLLIRHWNLIDVTEACPQERHRPDLPKIPIYVNDDIIKAISKENFDELDITSQEKYVEHIGYAGCLSNCNLYAACKSRLATHQLSKSNLLKKISNTAREFKQNSLERVKAQLLCLKPSTEGLVLPRFEQSIHLISAETMYEMLSGESTLSKVSIEGLYGLLNRLDAAYYTGMDFGYSHCFAYALGAVVGSRVFIVDALEVAGLELSQRIVLCEQKLKPIDSIIYPDTAYPADIKTFQRHGFKMRNWNKGKGSLSAGIEALRMKIWPSIGEPEFFILNNEGGQLLAKRLSEYHFKLDSAGRPTEIPDEDNDDLVDACRYLVQNVFPLKGKSQIVTATQTSAEANATALEDFAKEHQLPNPAQENWLQQLVHTQVDSNLFLSPTPVAPSTKKSGIILDF